MKPVVLLLVALVWAVGTLACGGQVAPAGDGGSPSDTTEGGGAGSGGGASGGSTVVPPCPGEPPTVGTKCVGPQGCAYFGGGTSCQAFVCSDSGEWESSDEGC